MLYYTTVILLYYCTAAGPRKVLHYYTTLKYIKNGKTQGTRCVLLLLYSILQGKNTTWLLIYYYATIPDPAFALAAGERLLLRHPLRPARHRQDDGTRYMRVCVSACTACTACASAHMWMVHSLSCVDDVVYYDEWECTHTLENFNIIQEYCFLKQIEYYFDHCDSQMCWFHVYN